MNTNGKPPPSKFDAALSDLENVEAYNFLQPDDPAELVPIQENQKEELFKFFLEHGTTVRAALEAAARKQRIKANIKDVMKG